jgi:putative resolvase
MLISIGQAATVIGVAVSTLRRWEKEGRLLPSLRTKGGHRRYSLAQIEEEFFGKKARQSARKTLCYARVSSSSQRFDLQRQIASLEKHCKKANWTFTVLSDCGSGINYNRRGLQQLIGEICLGRVERLVLTHRDRLMRFGSPLLFKLCQFYGTEVVILNDKKGGTFEEELANDVIEIMTVYCAKIYGRRAQQNRRLHAKAA